MNLERLCRAIFTEAWYIQPSQFQAAVHLIPALAEFLNTGNVAVGQDVQDNIEQQGRENIPQARTRIVDGVGILPIEGIVGIGWDDWDKGLGAVDYDDIEDALNGLLDKEEVNSIVLDVDSPGGLVKGTHEMAETIAAATDQKPIFAYTRSLMASSAYYICAGCTAIYASKSALVGSIGTYMALLNVSGLYEKLGLKSDTISAGKFKTATHGDLPMTEEQRDDLQKHVDFAHADFKAFVTKYRTEVAKETMEGQIFWGEEAAANGLVDSIASLNLTISDAGKSNPGFHPDEDDQCPDGT